MVSDEVTAALARFFDGGLGPSHDELSRLIDRAGLGSADPRKDDAVAGKMKRVRAVLWHASENDGEAGDRLIPALIGALRASGSFRSSEPNFASASVIEALQSALDTVGYHLTDDGLLQPKSMEGLEGVALTKALREYVRRARTAGDDAALKIGSAKELCEATARHVVVERGGSYPAHGNFLTTLWQAYDALDLAKPSNDATQAVLVGDAWSNVEQAAFLLACAITSTDSAMRKGLGTDAHMSPSPPRSRAGLQPRVQRSSLSYSWTRSAECHDRPLSRRNSVSGNAQVST